MTTNAILKLCGGFEGALGVALIAFPDFVLRAFFTGGFSSDVLSSDVLVARVTGSVLLILGLGCWPRGEDEVSTSLLTSQFAYTALTAVYIAYLGFTGGFDSALLWVTSALHALLALLLAGITYERIWPKKPHQANQL